MRSIRQKAEAIAREKYSLDRSLSDEELSRILHELRVQQIELELQNDELRRTQQNLEAAQKKYFELYNFAPISYLTFDQQGLILEINLAGTHLLRRERRFILNRPMLPYLHASSTEVFFQHLDQVFTTKSHQSCEIMLNSSRLDYETHVQLESTPVRRGDIWVSLSALTDITAAKHTEVQLQKAVSEKEFLLKEVHHRVKNNLQIVNSLLNLQAAAIQDPSLKHLFHESQNRIKSIALIHGLLYQGDNLEDIDFQVYLDLLIKNLFISIQHSREQINLITQIERVPFEISTAIPCGMILNELITNALKYAFPGGQSGVIKVIAKGIPNGICQLIVEDNGVGLPPGMLPPNQTSAPLSKLRHQSLGLQLVQSLVQQIEGTATIASDNGTMVTINI